MSIVVSPILNCIAHVTGGFVGVFGYNNLGLVSITVPIGANNAFSGTSLAQNSGQPTLFLPGVHNDVFRVFFTNTATWTILSFLLPQTVTASSGSTTCACSAGVSFDCSGVCGGNKMTDCAGVCNGTSTVDCMGVCGGTATIDCTGVCNGTHNFDCAGVCQGTSTKDCAGICNGTTTKDCMGQCGGPFVKDCSGVCGGTHHKNCGGVCVLCNDLMEINSDKPSRNPIIKRRIPALRYRPRIDYNRIRHGITLNRKFYKNA